MAISGWFSIQFIERKVQIKMPTSITTKFNDHKWFVWNSSSKCYSFNSVRYLFVNLNIFLTRSSVENCCLLEKLSERFALMKTKEDNTYMISVLAAVVSSSEIGIDSFINEIFQVFLNIKIIIELLWWKPFFTKFFSIF